MRLDLNEREGKDVVQVWYKQDPFIETSDPERERTHGRFRKEMAVDGVVPTVCRS